MEEKIQEVKGVKFKLVCTHHNSDSCSGTFGYSNSLTIKDLIKINDGLEEVIGEFSKMHYRRGSHRDLTKVEYRGRTLLGGEEIHVELESEDGLFDISSVFWGYVAK